jgi:GNAT superfamily N-acetyltransferase
MACLAAMHEHEPDATVSLRPMRPDEFPDFLEASKRSYAEGIATHGDRTAEFARQKWEEDHAAVLPNGLDTPGHAIFVVEADGERVGVLWLAEREVGGRRVYYIYYVEIESAHRGKGHGRAAMLLAEDEARRRGLYRSLGYVETSAQMAKDLD